MAEPEQIKTLPIMLLSTVKNNSASIEKLFRIAQRSTRASEHLKEMAASLVDLESKIQIHSLNVTEGHQGLTHLGELHRQLQSSVVSNSRDVKELSKKTDSILQMSQALSEADKNITNALNKLSTTMEGNVQRLDNITWQQLKTTRENLRGISELSQSVWNYSTAHQQLSLSVHSLSEVMQTFTKQLAKSSNESGEIKATIGTHFSCTKNVCQNGGTCVHLEVGSVCHCHPSFNGLYCEIRPTDGEDFSCAKTAAPGMAASCKEFYDLGIRRSGEYTLNISSHIKQVWCDMATDGGGWTVFQRRKDGLVNFYRNWADYKNGFGNVFSDLWLGNEWIHQLTARGDIELRIDFNRRRFAKYSNFSVSDESSKYRLNLSGFIGNVANYMSFHNNRRFSTKDQDNDNFRDVHCAQLLQSGWWYSFCSQSDLNGLYGRTGLASLRWGWRQSSFFYPMFVEMKLR